MSGTGADSLDGTICRGVGHGSLLQRLASPDFRVAIVFLLFSFSVYLANWRLISAGDTYPARYLPFSILKHGSLYLDPIAGVTSQGDPHPYWILHRYGHDVSYYPIVVPLLLTPLYAPAVAWLNIRGWTEKRLDSAARLMEKFSAALIASFSVALMYFLLRRRAATGPAALLTVAYAFGTNSWMICSQALWQHGVGTLLIVATLYLLTGACSDKRALAVGLLCGLIACNRPPDALLSLALGGYGMVWAHGRRRCLVAGAAAPLALLLAYNLYVVHELVGGYARKGNLSTFHYGLLTGIAGLLFSPARGLFIFTPFLLFLPFGINSVLADQRFRRLDLLLLAAIVLQVLCYAKLDWRAGCSWGPRWLTDIQPLMIWMLAPVIIRAGRTARLFFVIAVCFSIGVQTVGAFWYSGKSDEILMAEEGDPGGMKSVWDLKNTPYVVELAHEAAPRGILHSESGYIDTVQVAGSSLEKIPIGSEVEIEGWALTDLHTPARVTVSLMPVGKTKWRGPKYYPVVQITNFGPRPDVSETMHCTGPCGWSATLQTDGFDPGEHEIVLNAKANDLLEFHPAARRRVMMVDNDRRGKSDRNSELDIAAKEAGAHAMASQQSEGYWLTAYTQTDRLVHPKMERNTFLEAMMIDVLQPVAIETGLYESLERARADLAEQIESDGLVRYHGCPISPMIPALGCVITPDSDDTALAWRLAGREKKSLLPRVLLHLKNYKTPEGLFQTWLAPVDKYVSIDPGKDPNPADIGIQMHVLMFLDGVDKPAARTLFEALQKAGDDNSHWVYYQKAPLVPLLRQGDLCRLGYPLALPPERMRTSVPGQEPWVAACKMISSNSSNKVEAPAAINLLLTRLAADHFSEIKKSPPLLYHNDLSARASRFYWSEDFGYALWLRLYYQSRSVRNGGAISASY